MTTGQFEEKMPLEFLKAYRQPDLSSLARPAFRCISDPLGKPESQDGGSDTIESPALVSIITVTFNASRTIGQAILSVRSQTYNNIEHIVVDGGSTDQTLALIERFPGSLTFLVSEPDRGIYDAMNKGLAHASGEYIVLLNSDDWLYPSFIKDSVLKLQEEEADISYCNYLSESGPVICPDINLGVLFTQLNIKHNSFTVRRRVYEQIGGFDPEFDISADAKWNRKAFLSGFKFVRIDRELLFYSALGKSSSATEAEKQNVVKQSARLHQQLFPMLDAEEASALYLSNFNTHHLAVIDRLLDNYRDDRIFVEAIREFVRFNFRNRPGYLLDPLNAPALAGAIRLATKLNIDLRTLTFQSEYGFAPALMASLEQIRERRESFATCHLHFARRFSAPTEPFIYHFIRNQASDSNVLQVTLCDERLLQEERPLGDVLVLPYNSMPAESAEEFYSLIFSYVQPQVLICHFALNGYHLWRRLNSEQRQISTVNICHGVDVFVIPEDAQYRHYVLQTASLLPNFAFAAVSEFLRQKLIEFGVAPDKTFVVPNVVSPRFIENRKTDGFYDGRRELRVLCIGRFISWKAQPLLIQALQDLHVQNGLDYRLTLVYGGWAEQIASTQDVVERSGAISRVEYVSFVDFENDPGFYSRFDLYVQPSTLSAEASPRTETFGVAVLEAISAGLPVIVTDVGGLPEVVGSQDHAHAIVVEHGSAPALAAGIASALANCEEVFSDNLSYARERSSCFNLAYQFAQFQKVLDFVTKRRLRFALFTSLMSGGAANGTFRLHRALMQAGVDSTIYTRSTEKIPSEILNITSLVPEYVSDFGDLQDPSAQKKEFTVFSLDGEIVSDETLRDVTADKDAIVLGWHARFLSTSNVAMLTRLGKPVFIILRDMNSITGGCHYFHGCERWQSDCRTCPQLKNNLDDFPKLTLAQKRAHWQLENVTFVALSSHSRKTLEASALASQARIAVIGNVVDSEEYFRENPDQSRQELGLLQDTTVIGYMPSFGSAVKGGEHFLLAMQEVKRLRPDVRIEVALAGTAQFRKSEVKFRVREQGKLTSSAELRRFYSALSFLVVPSTEETFSNTVVESLACGTPVIGFATGILPELAGDSSIASAVPVGDWRSMARAILSRIDDGGDPDACRAAVASRFDKRVIVQKYLDAFHCMLSRDPGEVVHQVAATDDGLFHHHRKLRSGRGLGLARARLQASLKQALKNSPEQVSVLQVGRKAEFGKADAGIAFIRSGWSVPEHNWTWTIGDKSQLAFRVSENVAVPLLSIEFSSLASPDHELRLEFLLDGLPIGEVIRTTSNPSKSVLFINSPLSASVLSYNLEIRANRTFKAPKDSRALVARVFSLELNDGARG